MTEKVLVVSYTFPPTGGAGVQRVSKFVKYLREFAWEPVVLTALNPSVPLCDLSLLVDIPEGIAIHKAKTLEPSYDKKQNFNRNSAITTANTLRGWIKTAIKGLLLPDAQILWWPHLIKSLNNILGSGDISCVFVTAPPFSVLIPSVFFANRYRVPIVVDFRDEWSFSRDQWENTSKNTLARMIDNFFEGYVLRNCTKFTAATQSYVDSILRRHPYLGENKGYTITNGYDADDIIANEFHTINDKLTFVYTGTVWSATSLQFFVSALNKLVSERPELTDQISVNIIGRVVDSELNSFTGAAASCITLVGYIDHKDVMLEIMKSNILILSLSDLPGAERIIPGKLFEYMATGKHIFAIVPEGETKRLIKDKYLNATIADSSSFDDVYQKVNSIIETVERTTNTNFSVSSEFSRKHLTSKLADILRQSLTSHGS